MPAVLRRPRRGSSLLNRRLAPTSGLMTSCTRGDGPKYIALYHLASPGVVDTPEWKQASASTAMPQRVRDQISDRLRLVCRNYVRP